MASVDEIAMTARGGDTKRATSFDVRIGQTLKRRRVTLGMTQEQLASELGISWQQLQKYEAGTNRISAGRLAHMADVLRTDVGWLLRPEVAEAVPAVAEPAHTGNLHLREISELISVYSRITSSAERRKALEILKVMAGPTLPE